MLIPFLDDIADVTLTDMLSVVHMYDNQRVYNFLYDDNN